MSKMIKVYEEEILKIEYQTLNDNFTDEQDSEAALFAAFFEGINPTMISINENDFEVSENNEIRISSLMR